MTEKNFENRLREIIYSKEGSEEDLKDLTEKDKEVQVSENHALSKELYEGILRGRKAESDIANKIIFEPFRHWINIGYTPNELAREVMQRALNEYINKLEKSPERAADFRHVGWYVLDNYKQYIQSSIAFSKLADLGEAGRMYSFWGIGHSCLEGGNVEMALGYFNLANKMLVNSTRYGDVLWRRVGRILLNDRAGCYERLGDKKNAVQDYKKSLMFISDPDVKKKLYELENPVKNFMKNIYHSMFGKREKKGFLNDLGEAIEKAVKKPENGRKE